jgi:hypothetical protein
MQTANRQDNKLINYQICYKKERYYEKKVEISKGRGMRNVGVKVSAGEVPLKDFSNQSEQTLNTKQWMLTTS